MDIIIIFAFIIPFIINTIILQLLSSMNLTSSNKIILIIFVSIFILYILYKYKDEIELIENYFVKYIIILFLLLCIYHLVVLLYSYGLTTNYSKIIIIGVFGVLFIVFNIYLFNSHFDEIYPLHQSKNIK